MYQDVKIGVHPLDTARNDIVLDLSAASPVTHGMLQIQAKIDNEVITWAEVILGGMHRGAEKLFESRDYRQILMLANRHEWLSPITGEVGLAEMLETALGIAVPDQAVNLRKALINYSKITSHLAFLAGFPFADSNLIWELRQHRETLITHQQSFIGNRMHPMITRISGFTHSPSKEWLAATLPAISQTIALLEKTKTHLNSHPQFRTLGVLTQAVIDEFSISGPAATPGAVCDRLLTLVSEIDAAVAELHALIPVLISNLNQPVNVLLPKVPRIPEGEYVHSISTPLGISRWFFVSRGDKLPYRLKLRPASLHTLLAIGRALEGAKLADAKFIVASMPFLTGDAER